jgi:hypothetical protein
MTVFFQVIKIKDSTVNLTDKDVKGVISLSRITPCYPEVFNDLDCNPRHIITDAGERLDPVLLLEWE